MGCIQNCGLPLRVFTASVYSTVGFKIFVNACLGLNAGVHIGVVSTLMIECPFFVREFRHQLVIIS